MSLKFSLIPSDACSFYRCKSYEECVVKKNAAKCRCPRCPPQIDDPVCADNGKTYPSACAMRIKGCKGKRELKVVRKGSCGKL